MKVEIEVGQNHILVRGYIRKSETSKLKELGYRYIPKKGAWWLPLYTPSQNKRKKIIRKLVRIFREAEYQVVIYHE